MRHMMLMRTRVRAEDEAECAARYTFADTQKMRRAAITAAATYLFNGQH